MNKHSPKDKLKRKNEENHSDKKELPVRSVISSGFLTTFLTSSCIARLVGDTCDGVPVLSCGKYLLTEEEEKEEGDSDTRLESGGVSDDRLSDDWLSDDWLSDD